MGCLVKIFMVFRFFILFTLIGYAIHTPTDATGYSTKQDTTNKPPEVIKGGEWSDHFWVGQLQDTENIDIQASHLFLKFKEQLNWKQTWTAHFVTGEFWHTEAVSDSVRLSWNESEQGYFMTGNYTSTVYYAGKSVDWSTAMWKYSGIPDGLVIEFRTGNTPIPDGTWTIWQLPVQTFTEDYCAYTYNTGDSECFSTLKGIDSSQYIQYRALFNSEDSQKTVALYEINFVYGIHNLTGSAVSILIPPEDLHEWESVIITSTNPDNTSLVIDVLAPDGTVLIPNVSDGSSLAGIDPILYPGIQLRANLITLDESITPDIDLWGLKWSIWNMLYLPTVLR
jgi:hypothetical protein